MDISKIRNQWFVSKVREVERSGITQVSIAKAMGVMPQYLTPILSGKRNISEKLLDIFCKQYNINQKELYIEVGAFARLMTAAAEAHKSDENDKSFVMNSSERIRQIEQFAGLSTKALAEAIGTQSQNLYDIHKGRHEISKRLANLIQAKYLNVDLVWLLTGVGSMLKENISISAIAMPAPIATNEGIPLIPVSAMAGFGTGDIDGVLEYECERYIVPAFKGAEFLITVRGSSMYPKYSNGDIVACRKVPLDTFFQWNKIYVIDSTQGALIKRVHKGTDEAHIILISENEKYEPFEIHRQEIRSLAIVMGVIRLE
jgi:phage repressor protein C with HTH and peptisase S24 domain